ncbi:Uncharacterized protein FWK35_00015406 [Aphis craccivora]|uniref:Uncharacterized protein n=1 Tax=Aphis craccivora TaxID=307492 RepID=A0A6G0Z2K4_APHCR|nr:Uncharacterized protein FWK35_00015406 [Aphis craccivora]
MANVMENLKIPILISEQLIRNLFLNYNHIKKIDVVENWFCVKIPVFPKFFWVFPGAFENYWEIQKMTSLMHQLDSLCYRKPPP